jgi:hypothetical protein
MSKPRYDLLWRHDYCAGVDYHTGAPFKADYIVVEATSEKGQIFLDAYSEATDREYDGNYFEGDDGTREVEALHFMERQPQDFERFKRQASLACITIGEMEEEAAA